MQYDKDLVGRGDSLPDSSALAPWGLGIPFWGPAAVKPFCIGRLREGCSEVKLMGRAGGGVG
jgi:hypothetical protein